mmetsp:Transcript_5301/g.19822  ORF Transcript_5301/g.19822 Transcript_5301/m.19822 type:complete len:119 (+) Transcript_5301:459-815(+)
MSYAAVLRGSTLAIAALASFYFLFFCDGSGVLEQPEEQQETTLETVLATYISDSDEDRPFVTPRCDVCCDRRKDSVLNCGHCFCQECLRNILKRQTVDSTATCPTCRRPFRTFSTLHL